MMAAIPLNVILVNLTQPKPFYLSLPHFCADQKPASLISSENLESWQNFYCKTLITLKCAHSLN